jgi:hypothetical protein
MSKRRRVPRLRRMGTCPHFGVEAGGWPLLRIFGKRGRRIACCPGCRGPV